MTSKIFETQQSRSALVLLLALIILVVSAWLVGGWGLAVYLVVVVGMFALIIFAMGASILWIIKGKP